MLNRFRTLPGSACSRPALSAASLAAAVLAALMSVTPAAADHADDLKRAQEYIDKHMTPEQRELAKKLASEMKVTPAELMLQLGLDMKTLGEDSKEPIVPPAPPSASGGSGTSGGGDGAGKNGMQ